MDRIKLKQIKHYSSLSQETNAFSANVYFDGKKVGECKNGGWGGCTLVYYDDKQSEARFCEHVEMLPVPEDYKSFCSVLSDADVCDLLFEKWAKEKESARLTKKLEKDCLRGLCYNHSGKVEDGYLLASWTQPIAVMVVKYPDLLRKAIQERFSDGKLTLFNTNIPESFFV